MGRSRWRVWSTGVNKMKYVLSLILIVFLVGCGSLDNGFSTGSGNSSDLNRAFKSQKENTESLEKINDLNTQIAEDIQTEAEKAKSSTSGLLNFDVSPEQKQSLISIDNNLDAIISRSKSLENNLIVSKEKIANIKSENKNIEKGVDYVKSLEQKVQNLIKSNDELRNNAIKDLYSYLAAFFGIGFLTIIAGIAVAIFVNPKLGASISVVGLLGNAAAAAMIYYMQTVAMISIVIIIATIVISLGIGLYYLFFVNKRNNENSVAAEENIKLIEKIKPILTPEQRTLIFGEKHEVPLVDKVQTPTTKKIVQRIKKSIKG